MSDRLAPGFATGLVTKHEGRLEYAHLTQSQRNIAGEYLLHWELFAHEDARVARLFVILPCCEESKAAIPLPASVLNEMSSQEPFLGVKPSLQ